MNNINQQYSQTKSSGSMVPEAREALSRFKYEVASEIGVPLKQGYNGDLTSAQNGSVGGYMVKNVLPIRTTKYERENRSVMGHCTVVTYNASIIMVVRHKSYQQ